MGGQKSTGRSKYHKKVFDEGNSHTIRPRTSKSEMRPKNGHQHDKVLTTSGGEFAIIGCGLGGKNTKLTRYNLRHRGLEPYRFTIVLYCIHYG